MTSKECIEILRAMAIGASRTEKETVEYVEKLIKRAKKAKRWKRKYLEMRSLEFSDKNGSNVDPFNVNWEVGDEVVSIYGDRGYVTGIDETELCVLYPNGMVGHSTMNCYTKTGKHFPQMEKILKKMQKSVKRRAE